MTGARGSAATAPDSGSSARRLTLISYRLRRDSGESRLTFNLARGLRDRGFAPVVLSLDASAEVREEYRTAGVDLRVDAGSWGAQQDWQMMAYRPTLARRVARMARGLPPSEVYLVVQDAAIPVAAEPLPGRTAYLCNGDMQLLLLDPGFRAAHRWGTTVLSARFVRALEHHSALVRRFDRVLANSEFTRGLMSFLYDAAIEGVVYPPVDTRLFAPGTPATESPPYALAVLKSPAEPAYRAIARIAQQVRVRIIGRATAPHAETLGLLDDAALVEQYRGARVTLSPSFREFFGYALAESMACGTPCVAFDQGGAHEIVRPGHDGWLVRSEPELERVVTEQLCQPPDPALRARCVESARRFSIDASTDALTKHLGLS